MTTKKKTSKCAALQFPANMKPDVMLAALKAEWVKRNILADGSLNPNSYAPIWFYKGETRGMASRGTGDDSGRLLIYTASANILLPQKRTEWVG